MQRDIENMAPRPAKPRRHAAQLVVLFQQQHAATGPGERVGRGQASQAAADHDAIVVIANALKKITWHVGYRDSSANAHAVG